MTETTTIKLSRPIEHDGKTYTELKARAAVLGDLLMADVIPSGEQRKQAAVYASISGVPYPAFIQISPLEYQRFVELVDTVSGNGLPTASDQVGAKQPG